MRMNNAKVTEFEMLTYYKSFSLKNTLEIKSLSIGDWRYG